MLAKDTEDLLRSKSENDSIAIFSKRKFSFFSFPQKLKKVFIWTCRMQLWQPCPKISRQTSENLCSKMGNDEKFISLPENLLVKLFVWTCTMKFWQACRNIVGKNTKNNRKNQKRWKFFWTKRFYFYQKVILYQRRMQFWKR